MSLSVQERENLFRSSISWNILMLYLTKKRLEAMNRAEDATLDLERVKLLERSRVYRELLNLPATLAMIEEE